MPAGPRTVTRIGSCARDRSVERLDQAVQLAPPSDEGGVEAPGECGRQLHDFKEAVCGEALRLALERQLSDSLGGYRVPDEPVRFLTEQNLVRRGSLLQPRGDVDRVARGVELTAGGVAHHRLARIDPGADAKRDSSLALEIRIQVRECLLHFACGPHGPKRVILMRGGNPKHGHDRVADELLDSPPMTLERRSRLREVALHHAPKRLRVEPLSERRRARDVCEHDGDGLARFHHRSSVRLAVCALHSPARTYAEAIVPEFSREAPLRPFSEGNRQPLGLRIPAPFSRTFHLEGAAIGCVAAPPGDRGWARMMLATEQPSDDGFRDLLGRASPVVESGRTSNAPEGHRCLG